MTTELATQNDVMKWVLDNGEELQFTIEDARNMAGNDKVTPKEFALFSKLCAVDKLNPLTKDAYLIKYGTSPAQYITGKNSILKIATRSKNYNGYKAGIIVLDKSGKIIHREGAMVYEDLGEKLIGGWGKVFKKDGSEPAYIEVSLKEYIGKKGDGSTNKQWREKAATMIRKVGFSQSHREAFPENLSSWYDESEVAAIENSQGDKDNSTKTRINDIFGYKDDKIIEGEAEEVPEDKPDVLANELKIYAKALKLTDEKINELFEKHNVSSWEELTDEVKQKCIDRLKPQYEALKQKSSKTEEAIKENFDDDIQF